MDTIAVAARDPKDTVRAGSEMGSGSTDDNEQLTSVNEQAEAVNKAPDASYSINFGYDKPGKYKDEAPKASLPIRFEDLRKRLEQLTLEAIERPNSNKDWALFVHAMDEYYSDLQTWQYDIEIRRGRLGASEADDEAEFMDLSSYDVLQILETQQVIEPHENSIFFDIRQELQQLERCVASLSSHVASRTLTEEKYQTELAAAISRLNELKKPVRETVSHLLKKYPMSELFGKRKPPSILSFDGGGVSTLSSLLILHDLMKRVAALSSDLPDGEVLPRDIFEYIFGASSGGLSAIMLGRLKMSVPAAIHKFQEHATAIFARPAWRYFALGGLIGPKYSGEGISKASWSVIRDTSSKEGAATWNLNKFAIPSDSCKTGSSDTSDTNATKRRRRSVTSLVRGVQKGSPLDERPHFLRTYNHPASPQCGEESNQGSMLLSSSTPGLLEGRPWEKGDPDGSGQAATCEIWEAARATSAAPYYFPSVVVDGREMYDGGFGINNPSLQALLAEVQPMEGAAADRLRGAVFVSIGTGTGASPADVNENFEMSPDPGSGVRWRRTGPSSTSGVNVIDYFRFNAPGIQDVSLDDFRAMSSIHAATLRYLDRGDVRQSLDRCAKRLVENRRMRR
ncbi:FabD/lysophospholipase-like protein [Thozetella sp. PMI_491]|nr:FabD/lysophospholipase-like protein [Thozetella sp. PMI_491]